MLGIERFRFRHTALTDREAENLLQCFAADAAGIGKNQGKKGVKG